MGETSPLRAELIMLAANSLADENNSVDARFELPPLLLLCPLSSMRLEDCGLLLCCEDDFSLLLWILLLLCVLSPSDPESRSREGGLRGPVPRENDFLVSRMRAAMAPPME